jgi:nitrate reductase gamma subunit
MGNPLVFIVECVLPYFTAIVFAVGIVGTMMKWSQVRIPLRITVTPAPSSVVGDIVSELILFKTLFRGTRALWGGGWVFHVCLALALVGHLFGIGVLAHQFMVLGASASQSEQLSAFFGGIAGLGMLAALLYLLYRRTTVKEVQAISDVSDYLVLLLVISIVVTGNYMRFFTHVDLAEIRDFVGSLLAFRPVPPANSLFVVHFFFVQLLLLYFPYSKLMHSCGMFFTRWLMGKRDLVSPKEVGA